MRGTYLNHTLHVRYHCSAGRDRRCRHAHTRPALPLQLAASLLKKGGAGGDPLPDVRAKDALHVESTLAGSSAGPAQLLRLQECLSRSGG